MQANVFQQRKINFPVLNNLLNIDFWMYEVHCNANMAETLSRVLYVMSILVDSLTGL